MVVFKISHIFVVLSTILLPIYYLMSTMVLMITDHYNHTISTGDSISSSHHWSYQDKIRKEYFYEHKQQQGQEVPRNQEQQLKQNQQRHHEGRKIYTIFSTGCSKAQDWQSQVLVYSHKKQNIPGDIIRLMSCRDPGYVLPKQGNHYPNYYVVRTPEFNMEAISEGYDNYSPRNRPAAVYYWLSGQGNDTYANEKLPNDNDVIISVDPDQIFLSNGSQLNITNIRHGYGVAAQYGIGSGFFDKWKQYCGVNYTKICTPPFNNDKTNPSTKEEYYDPSFGHPQILTAKDTKHHSKLWINITNSMRIDGDVDWQTEMYSNVISLRRLGINMNVEKFQISMPTILSLWEPWDVLQWSNNPYIPKSMNTIGIVVSHYCQEYKINTFKFFKHYYTMLDIRKCNNTDLLKYLPSLTTKTTTTTLTTTNINNSSNNNDNNSTIEIMKKYRNQSMIIIDENNITNKDNEQVYLSRNVWMLDHTYTIIKEALHYYYKEVC